MIDEQIYTNARRLPPSLRKILSLIFLLLACAVVSATYTRSLLDFYPRDNIRSRFRERNVSRDNHCSLYSEYSTCRSKTRFPDDSKFIGLFLSIRCDSEHFTRWKRSLDSPSGANLYTIFYRCFLLEINNWFVSGYYHPPGAHISKLSSCRQSVW